MRFHDLIGRNEMKHYFMKNSSELIYIFMILIVSISYIYVFYVLTVFFKDYYKYLIDIK